MRRLMIDTNTYLSFYRFFDDDLEELRKLATPVKENEIRLWALASASADLLRFDTTHARAMIFDDAR